MRRLRTAALVLSFLFYYSAGVLTGAHYYNKTVRACETMSPLSQHYITTCMTLPVDCVMTGIFWPVYWSFHLALEQTK